ncbi:MAG: sorbosone dehydrogenase family protein [Sedimentibacter sp.]
MNVNKPNETQRYVNPLDIYLLPGYTIEVFAQGLNGPVSMVFDENGDIIVGESGEIDGNARVMRLTKDGYEIVAEGFNVPLTGVNILNGDIYVSHSGVVTVIKTSGKIYDLITGLPSIGDYKNTQVIFGSDGKMYFGQGSATNSGVVGLDNSWAVQYPYFHDYPAEDTKLIGQNFVSYNFLSYSPKDYAFTGAFRPFGLSNRPNSVVYGSSRPTSCIYRADFDGSNLEVYAWGITQPYGLNFDEFNRLYATNLQYDDRGSRPIKDAWDEFLLVEPGVWYGFPDYSSGLPVTLPQFRPDVGPKPEFLLTEHPMNPPKPYAVVEPHSGVRGFDFDYSFNFGPYGNAYVAESGSIYPVTTGGYPLPGVGRRIVRINMDDGSLSTFAINRSGLGASFSEGGGFARPWDVVFGPDGEMYVLDFGTAYSSNPNLMMPNTGVIWKISRS